MVVDDEQCNEQSSVEPFPLVSHKACICPKLDIPEINAFHLQFPYLEMITYGF